MKRFYLIIIIIILSVFFQGNKTAEKEVISVKELTDRLIKNAESNEKKLEIIYYYVRDEIKFGWVYPNDIPVEETILLKKGICMQKMNVFVSMTKAAGFKSRFKFVYIQKNGLRDFIPDFAYNKWMDPFPHTITEVYLNGKWVSFDPSIDMDLHNICLEKNLNFARSADIRNISTEFSIDGVKGHQQYFEVNDKEAFYGETLQPLMDWNNENVPKWKKSFKKMIFQKADKIILKLRNEK